MEDQVKPENLHDFTKTIHTISDVDRELCHYHMKDKVTPDEIHECHICTKTFVCESALTIHLCKHTEEKRYQCSSCEKTYLKKSHLVLTRLLPLMLQG